MISLTMNYSSPRPSAAEQSHSNTGKMASVVALSVVMLFAIFGNVVIIVIFRMFKRVRKQVTNHFLINLAISDLIVAIVTMPFWLTYEIDRWESMPENWDHETLTLMWTIVDITCEASSIANLAVISIDRLYSVRNPFKHHTTVTPSVAHRIIFGVWGYAIAVASIFLLDTKWRILIIAMLGFLVPLTVMVASYMKIILVVRSCRRRWSTNPDASKHYFGCIVNEYKTAKSLGVVMVAFVICWTPFFFFSCLMQYCTACVPWFKARPEVPTVSKWLHYLNSALNPVLYTLFNPSYSVVFRRFYAWCLRKDYHCTSYEAWYLGSRRVSTNSQRSSSLNHPSAANRNSYSSIHRLSCGSVTATRQPERSEIVPTDCEKTNDDVFVDGTTNEGASTGEENGQNGSKGFPNRLAVRQSTSKNRVSFSDSDTIV